METQFLEQKWEVGDIKRFGCDSKQYDLAELLHEGEKAGRFSFEKMRWGRREVEGR